MQDAQELTKQIFFLTYQDFNGSSGDLGGDTQSLEERGLLRTQPSVLSRHGHLTGGDSTGTGGSWHLRR